MKTALRFSLLLNLVLFSGVLLLLAGQRKHASASPSGSPKVNQSAGTPAVVPASSTAPAADPSPFHWSQLESADDYRAYIANLRAVGCPEATIEDIVRGDAARTFSWERKQQGLDGTGAGPWSRARELQLVASLLGAQPPADAAGPAQDTRYSGETSGEIARTSVPAQDVPRESPSYPLFLQNADWKALGFTAEEQAVIAQVRQQFQDEVGSLNQISGNRPNPDPGAANADGNPPTPDPNDTAALTRWHQALEDANQKLRDQMGAQAYMAYEQQQYYAWYQPQAAAAAASGQGLTINPTAFSLQ